MGMEHTVKPPNKVHIGDDTNSAVKSSVERSSSRRFKSMGKLIIGTLKVSCVERSIILCPYLRGSTIRHFILLPILSLCSSLQIKCRLLLCKHDGHKLYNQY